ncbi:MAG: hypothetical protein KUL88_23460 [Rhizobium sp.]|nr:hypothetical protein [Rhizobium sp.]
MDEPEEFLLKERLRLKWLPVAKAFDPTRADDYDRFLALAVDEQTDLVRKMNEDDAEL